VSIVKDYSAWATKMYRYTLATNTYLDLGNGGSYHSVITNSSVVGDTIMYQHHQSNGRKYREINITVDAAIAAGTFTGVWEYCALETSSDKYNPDWLPLQNVVDGTNGFQNVGTNTLTYDMPDKTWANFLRPGATTQWYHFNIRFRITSIGAISNVGAVSEVDITSKCIVVSDQDTNFEEIYQASEAGGWGYVTKQGASQYTFDASLKAPSNYLFTSLNEQIRFIDNHGCSIQGQLMVGELNAEGLAINGSEIVIEQYNCSASSTDFGWVNSEYYNSIFKFVIVTGSKYMHGAWGGTIGGSNGQKIDDVTIVSFRQTSPKAKIVIKNLVQIRTKPEPIGATIIGGKIGGDSYGAFLSSGDIGLTMHQVDITKVIKAAVSPYKREEANWYMNIVDCETNYATALGYWTSPTDKTQMHTHQIRDLTSLEMMILDEADNGINNVEVNVYDNTQTLVDTYYSDIGGGVTDKQMTATGIPTIDTIQATSVDNATLRFRELVMTSGNAKGQRSVIHDATTDTFTLAEPFTVAPSSGDTFCLIPYIAKRIDRPTGTATAYGTTTNHYPFTFKMSKNGYEPVSLTLDMLKGTKTQIRMNTMDVTNEI